MYAIREANRGYGIGGRSADKHTGEWWSAGKGRWTVASDEATMFDSREAAEAEGTKSCTRDFQVVEIDD